MPIHEYRCTQCGHRFEELILGRGDREQVVCPECGARRTERLMSAFATAGADKGSSCGSGGGAGFS